MIVDLVADTRARLDLARRLELNQNEIRSIEATRNELRQLEKASRDLATALAVCRPRLGGELLAAIGTKANEVAAEVERSRQSFATSRRQSLPLNNSKSKVQRLVDDLAGLWRLHAQARLNPYLELLTLVTYLPEVAASEEEIRQIVAQVKSQVSTPPRSDAQLAQLDQRLGELGRRLDAVARLPEEVRHFLSRVVSETATLADLTPAVLAWVGEGERASAFAVKFVTRNS